MPIIPEQLRSVDPFSENRFSDNYNLRSRMLTGGEDSVIYLESFAITASGDHEITISPGMAIKDDVLVHILENTVIDLTQNLGYMVSSEGEPPLQTPTETTQLHVCLHYHYARTIPAPQAKFVLMKHPELNFSPINHIWLGVLNIQTGIITNINMKHVTVFNTTYYRRVINPIYGYSRVNGGVIRPLAPGEPVGWFEEWEYF